MTRKTLPHDHEGGQRMLSLAELLPVEESVEAAADVFKQLGDPTRLKVFWLLCHCEECVVNIAAAIGMSSPAVSHHLKVLRSAGLIVGTRRGKEVYYTARDGAMRDILHGCIEDVLSIECDDRARAE